MKNFPLLNEVCLVLFCERKRKRKKSCSVFFLRPALLVSKPYSQEINILSFFECIFSYRYINAIYLYLRLKYNNKYEKKENHCKTFKQTKIKEIVFCRFLLIYFSPPRVSGRICEKKYYYSKLFIIIKKII